MKPTIQLCKFQLWSPKLSAADDIRRLALAPLSTKDKKNPSLRAIVATDASANHFIVPAKHIAAFLQQQQDTHLIFDEIGIDFWAIHQQLRESDKSAARAWRKRLATSRFSSVPLFDQLLHLATAQRDDDTAIPPRTLNEIVDNLDVECEAVELPGKIKLGDLGPSSRLRAAATRTVLILRAYAALRRQARTIFADEIRAAEIQPDSVARYGLLTENLQAAAEIALTRMARHGIHTDRRRFTTTQASLKTQQQRLAVILDEHAPGLLVRNECDFEYTPTGRICRRDTVLDQQLRGAFEKFQRAQPDATLPSTEKGNLSRKPCDWKPFAVRSRFLETWSELEQTQDRLHALQQLDAVRIHPIYTTLLRSGRTSCSQPPLQSLPRSGGIRESIVPRNGYAFLMVDCQCFELVAIASICRHRFRHSKLAEVLADGRDPHAWTASKILPMNYRELMKLKTLKPQQFRQWRDLAKPINFGVPGGMSEKALVDYAQQAFGVTFSLADAREFRASLIEDVYPELRQFLHDEQDTAVTLTGRVRGGTSYTQSHNTQFQGLAADAAKLALVRLVAAKHRVVLFVHDEFLIEIPCKNGTVDRATALSIVKLIEVSTSEVLQLPVSCEYVASSCWSKRAKRIKEVGERMTVWRPQG